MELKIGLYVFTRCNFISITSVPANNFIIEGSRVEGAYLEVKFSKTASTCRFLVKRILPLKFFLSRFDPFASLYIFLFYIRGVN